MSTTRNRHVPTGLYLGTRLVSATSGAWRALGNLESFSIGKTLDNKPINAPIFVCGLARSGSTIITELINQHPAIASHHYSDFPLTWLPYWWNQLRKRLPLPEQTARERAHADRIMITNDSPDAIEEVIWAHFFPQSHTPSARHVLEQQHRKPDFDKYYADHIRKLLLARQCSRYLAKNNYHVTRLEYLLSLFPDARFVIPVRDPMTQVASLCKQHRLFCQMSEEDPRVARQLQMSAHFEFGPQRCPIITSEGKLDYYADDLANASWYAQQWADVYDFLLQQIEANPALTKSCLVVSYENLCTNTEATLHAIFDHTNLNGRDTTKLIQRNANRISAPEHDDCVFGAEELDSIRTITGTTEQKITELLWRLFRF